MDVRRKRILIVARLEKQGRAMSHLFQTNVLGEGWNVLLVVRWAISEEQLRAKAKVKVGR